MLSAARNKMMGNSQGVLFSSEKDKKETKGKYNVSHQFL